MRTLSKSREEFKVILLGKQERCLKEQERPLENKDKAKSRVQREQQKLVETNREQTVSSQI